MDWRAALMDNWPYKLAALALAILLWFNVTADEQRQEQSVPTRLDIVLQDTAWVPVDVPNEVATTFQGRRGDFFAFALRANRPVIRKEIREVTDSVMRVPLSPGDVVYDRQLEVRPVAVQPSEVRLAFEPLAERQVPVTIDLEASAAEGFTVAGSPVVRPESVTVRGPRSVVASLSYVETEALALADLEETVTRQVALQLPDGLRATVTDPDQVLLTLEIDRLTEREFRVAVTPEGEAARTARIEPDSVTVTVRGARAHLDELSVDDVSAVVSLDEAPAEERRVEVELRLRDGVSATATAEPSRVTVRPVGGAGGRP